MKTEYETDNDDKNRFIDTNRKMIIHFVFVLKVSLHKT